MRRPRHHSDDGFSMIEVIVAIVILGIVASSALWFFINGMQTTSNLDRQQTSVSIATSAMERTFAVDPLVDTSAGVSGLVIGRSSAAVASAFAAVAGTDGVSDTYPLSDPAGGTPVIPIEENGSTSMRAGVQYTVYTLVGSCYRTASVGGVSQPCAKAALYPTTEPSTVPVGQVRMLRVIVVVTWEPIGEECDSTGGVCSYDVATLIDPSTDLEWNRVSKPFAQDDSGYVFNPGDSGYPINVLDNDLVGSLRNFPVQITDDIAAGAGTVKANSDGTISYTPPAGTLAAWKSGYYTFKYQVFERNGESSIATVTITLLPLAVKDTTPGFTAFVGAAQVLNVTANDFGSPYLIEIVNLPSLGSVSVSGTTLTYTATSNGTDSFSYKFTDVGYPDGLWSDPVNVTVKVEAVTAAPVAVTVPYLTSASTTGPWTDISSQLRGANPAGTKIIIKAAPTAVPATAGAGSLRIDGVIYSSGTVTGTVVEFQPPALSAKNDEWIFDFDVTYYGHTSPKPAQATMIGSPPPSPPVAVDDVVGNLKKNNTHTINVNTNDVPTTWPTDGTTIMTIVSISNYCGSTSTTTATDLAAGRIQITTPNYTNSNCVVTYKLKYGSNQSTGRITYNVTNN